MAKHRFQQDKEIADFETITIQQPQDSEGEVVYTLMRLKKEKNSPIVALHVHGFNDYCFHLETAQRFDEKGVDWYGIDLRKSGRSFRSHQKFNGLNALEEYSADLKAALKVIRDEGASFVLLMGHSLGGLAVSLFAAENTGKGWFDAVFLNSPFYEQNKDIVTKKALIPIVSALAKRFPKLPVPGGFSKFYGPSLHIQEKGEGDYNLQWKPHVSEMVHASWVRTVYHAQKKFKQGIHIQEPVLVMYPSKSVRGSKWKEEFHFGDAVVNVNDIAGLVHHIHGSVQVNAVENAKHDLFLSVPEVRQKVVQLLFDWMSPLSLNSLEKKQQQ